MSEWKEVWYVWDGVGSPPKHTKVKLKNGSIEGFTRSRIDWLRRNKNDGLRIVAYTKGEKRRRVECDSCAGFSTWLDNSGWNRCRACNGKGYRLERVG